MKKLKSNKRGVAIESAIFFMIVLFSLSFLIMSVSLSVAYRIKANDKLLESRLELDQAAELAISGITDLPYGYSCVVSSGENGATIYEIKKGNSNTLLRVETVESNGEKEVTKWIYK